ncbi:hypothetical protein E2C01_010604 [Portunus trituberculatus]|uniref:Uncharacterized protein n=1 Tax=Portunus trituberculatus TaxID=210409 RepID=A0A5B7D8U2_PORTR|nr:hypothetical protein [Portunus trituberculatus]
MTPWTMEEGLVRTHLAAMSVEGELVKAENDIFYGTFEVLVEGPTLLELFARCTSVGLEGEGERERWNGFCNAKMVDVEEEHAC